jgi:hypothetical protein
MGAHSRGRKSLRKGCLRMTSAVHALRDGRPDGMAGYGPFGTSSAGFRSKNSEGVSWNSLHTVGSTGQSSTLTISWNPSVYQSALSVFSMWGLVRPQMPRPSPP